MRTPGWCMVVVVAALLAGCSSPREKYEKCQKKCGDLKVDFAKRICSSSCEKNAYGDFDTAKLGSLCDEADPIACLRFATRGGKPADVAAKMQSCCDKKVALCCGGLGKMYSRGKVLERDRPKGYALMEKACELGDGTSCTSPGLKHMTSKNYKRAKELFTLGCAKESGFSCGLLGVIHRDGSGVPRDVEKARSYLDKACKLGTKSSCKALSRLR